MKIDRYTRPRIFEESGRIVLENDCAMIELCRDTATVLAVWDKQTGRNIRGEETAFLALHTRTEQIPLLGLTLQGNLLTVHNRAGDWTLQIEAFDRYFTLEMVSDLPADSFDARIGHVRYDYDPTDKQNTGAVCIPMTIWVNPNDYPDAKCRETYGRVVTHLGAKGAKLGLIIAPIAIQQQIIKQLCGTIDRNVGIVSSTGGAWGRDSRQNFSNYTIQFDSSKEFIADNVEYFRSIGVEQIDLHQGMATFRQGDFKFRCYESAAQFKQNVTDVLEANGMTVGLHTYSFYVAYDCDPILSDPVCQDQLKVMGHFTLDRDVTEGDAFLPLTESTSAIPTDRGFCRTNSPYVLVDREIIAFEVAQGGLRVTGRGCCGTVAQPHRKGATVKHLEGHYHGLTPVFGSPLFYQIARNTAKAYNEGGFGMIYLDALDGIYYHCEQGVEDWFYIAAFVCEILKYCKNDPVLEGATFAPCMWAARGRIGAWDTPYRGYKGFNCAHTKENLHYIDRYSAPILGWYDYYPRTDFYPGNEHTKYHHTDAIEHMGALAVTYDFANVFNGIGKQDLARYAGMRRNIALYKKYDDLRRAQYFTEDYRRRLQQSPWEYHLKQRSDGSYVFQEKDYQVAKLYDLGDAGRNTGAFCNPFGAQAPFVRIEAMLSTAYRNPIVLLPLDGERDLIGQALECSFDRELDLSDHLAKVVRVKGNGVLGGKIALKMRCATNSELGYGQYIIDTDFEGWREFILLESDNGERTDHGFEKNEDRYAIYRSSLNNDRITSLRVETEGDLIGVRMTSIVAYEHTYEVLKNPTLTVGESSVQFECELMASDFIEFDGKSAKVVDRYGNEKTVWFCGELHAPSGGFTASLSAKALNRGTPRAQLTLGFTGKEIE